MSSVAQVKPRSFMRHALLMLASAMGAVILIALGMYLGLLTALWLALEFM